MLILERPPNLSSLPVYPQDITGDELDRITEYVLRPCHEQSRLLRQYAF